MGGEIWDIPHFLRNELMKSDLFWKKYILIIYYFWNMFGLYWAEGFIDAKYTSMEQTNQSLLLTNTT